MKVILRKLYEEYSFIKEKLSDNEKEEYNKILSKAEDADLKTGVLTGIVH